MSRLKPRHHKTALSQRQGPFGFAQDKPLG